MLFRPIYTWTPFSGAETVCGGARSVWGRGAAWCVPSVARYVERGYALFRTTCPAANFRDSKKALDLAKTAIALADKDADREYFASWAGACAEVGDFERAVTEQNKALEDRFLRKEHREKMEKRLALYKEKKPYRDED